MEFTTLQDERHQRKRKLQKKAYGLQKLYVEPRLFLPPMIPPPITYLYLGALFFSSAHKVIVTHAFRINTSFFFLLEGSFSSSLPVNSTSK